ncbi:DarT ssDNA thymidine ADP-ribosyltransferase family protein [Lacticaseibacillus suihuaensis]
MTSYQEIVKRLVDGQIPTSLTPRQQRVWPRFAYHFTDINNAVSILKDGRLYSREEAQRRGQMRNDNASRDVIDQTTADVAGMVRLYFRPLTPTQFHNEGFKPRAKRSSLNADCPVPVFFLFDLPELLAQPNVQFSASTLARHPEPRLHSGAADFANLPFALIFHNGAIGPNEDTSAIVGSRQAEIVTPDTLNLHLLRHIVVRSNAEKVTLLTLLHDDGEYGYDALITDAEADLFYKDRSFVEQVALTSCGVSIQSQTNLAFPTEWQTSDGHDIRYAPESATPESFLDVQVGFKLPSGRVYKWPADHRHALLTPRIRLSFETPWPQYEMMIRIDNHIAFRGSYHDDDDLPF